VIKAVLLEGCRIALRHWAILVLSAAAILVGTATTTLLIGGCLFHSACVDSDTFSTLIQFVEWINWAGERLVYWPVSAIAFYRIVSLEHSAASDLPRSGNPSPSGMRPIFLCVLFFATLSAATQLSNVLFAVANVSLSLDFSASGRWALWVVDGSVSAALWSYVDAQFSLYLATIICGRGNVGFRAIWAITRRRRVGLFLAFFAIEIVLYIADQIAFFVSSRVDYIPLLRWLTEIVDIPRSFLTQFIPGLGWSSFSIALHCVLCAGVSVAAYRKFAAEDSESAAQVFA
jgi:hypothetical protein